MTCLNQRTTSANRLGNSSNKFSVIKVPWLTLDALFFLSRSHPTWQPRSQSIYFRCALLSVSFAQWHYRSQWGLTEARLLLIENFSQYPARRLEIQSAVQFLTAQVRALYQMWVKDISEKEAAFNYFASRLVGRWLNELFLKKSPLVSHKQCLWIYLLV